MWAVRWGWCYSNLLASNVELPWRQHPCVVCCRVVIISDDGAPPLPNVVWSSIAQLFKQATHRTHSFNSFIYQIRRRVICKWPSSHGTMGGWKKSAIRQTPCMGGGCFIINGRVLFLSYICSYSIFASWRLETLSRYSSALQLNLISPFLSIKSVKIPLEVLMRDAQLVSSQNDSAAEYQLHLAPSTWI